MLIFLDVVRLTEIPHPAWMLPHLATDESDICCVRETVMCGRHIATAGMLAIHFYNCSFACILHPQFPCPARSLHGSTLPWSQCEITYSSAARDLIAINVITRDHLFLCLFVMDFVARPQSFQAVKQIQIGSVITLI